MRIGRYETLAEIGRGGMGVVYKARVLEGPPGPAAGVAVKVLASRKDQASARFAREARLLSELGEPEGFVPLLDQGEERGVPYIVMPFLGGGTLRDRLALGPLPIEDVRAL